MNSAEIDGILVQNLPAHLEGSSIQPAPKGPPAQYSCYVIDLASKRSATAIWGSIVSALKAGGAKAEIDSGSEPKAGSDKLELVALVSKDRVQSCRISVRRDTANLLHLTLAVIDLPVTVQNPQPRPLVPFDA